MSDFRLTMPTDIPWTRRCVSEDMIDAEICDPDRPYRWRSSIAVFEYEPPEDAQEYQDLVISYLKVSCTITGYQEAAADIGLDYDDLRDSWQDAPGIDDYLDVLEAYYPCYGAIVEVQVGPSVLGGADIGDYPYILDVEPKRRELYELSTDTGEVASRSLSAVEVGKSTSTLTAHEVLDVDRGWRVATSASSPYGGGGEDVGAQGEWGTRDMRQSAAAHVRTSDTAREMRETQSHTTQLSQLYHQLDSYHIGTNRVVFFVHPRPHTIETVHTFVNGPRNIEGTQDFFLVIARKTEVSGICPSVYLETGHIGKRPAREVTQNVAGSERVDFLSGEFRAMYTVDEDTPNYDEEDRIWNVEDHWPGYVITGASIELGEPRLVEDDESRPVEELIDEAPHISYQDEHIIRVSGRVHSFYENITSPFAQDNRGGISYPFTLRIELARTETAAETEDVLFLTGRMLCCCTDLGSDIRDRARKLGRPRITYERPGIAQAQDPLKTLSGAGKRISIGEANAINGSLRRLLAETRRRGRYRIPNGGVLLNQADFVVSNLARLNEAAGMKLSEIELERPPRKKIERHDKDISVRTLLAAPADLLRRVYGLTPAEIESLREALTVPRPRRSNGHGKKRSAD